MADIPKLCPSLNLFWYPHLASSGIQLGSWIDSIVRIVIPERTEYPIPQHGVLAVVRLRNPVVDIVVLRVEYCILPHPCHRIVPHVIQTGQYAPKTDEKQRTQPGNIHPVIDSRGTPPTTRCRASTWLNSPRANSNGCTLTASMLARDGTF